MPMPPYGRPNFPPPPAMPSKPVTIQVSPSIRNSIMQFKNKNMPSLQLQAQQFKLRRGATLRSLFGPRFNWFRIRFGFRKQQAKGFIIRQISKL